MIVPIDKLIEACKNERRAIIREALPEEMPDFVQDRDKLTTGMLIGRKGGGFSFTLNPPVMLRAGVAYKIEMETA